MAFKIFQNMKSLLTPVAAKVKESSRRIYFRDIPRYTKKTTIAIYSSFIFIATILFYSILHPQKATIKLSKTAEKFGDLRIPKVFRKRFFKTYSKYYKVKLQEIEKPLQEFATFSQFFTRTVKPRPIDPTPRFLAAPADSKVLKIAEITEDENSIIKGASYSLGELLTGKPKALTKKEIQSMKQNPENKLYQVIFYLAPGDYHRFHSPTNFSVDIRRYFDGYYYGVSQKALRKLKKVYEKNTRLCLHGKWKEGYMSMVMVGALNVGRIIVNEGLSFNKGDQLGYFNLGSTIVMLFETKGIKKWNIKEGDKVRYGQTIFEMNE